MNRLFRRALHASAPRFAAAKRDFYEVLGIARDASTADIKKAYYKLAQKYHPDTNNGDKTAEARFTEIGQAYEALSNTEKRQAYDQFGHDAEQMGGMGGDPFGGQGMSGMDIFKEFFGGQGGGGMGGNPFQQQQQQQRRPTRGNHLQTALTLDFMDAVKGCQRTISVSSLSACEPCKGSGDKAGSTPSTCGTCHGSGMQTQNRGFLVIQTTCGDCEGEGVRRTKCGDCGGEGLKRERRRVTVTIPPGVDNDTNLRLQQQGDAGQYGGPRGHLWVRMSVKPHPKLRREGADVHVDVPVPITTALLGGNVTVPTLDKNVSIKVAPGCQPGDKRVIRKKGIKYVNRNEFGNLYIHLQVSVPKSLTAPQRALVEQLRTALGEDDKDKQKSSKQKGNGKDSSGDSAAPKEELDTEDPNTKKKGLFGKVKDFLKKE
jgi:molecular chaperone DnaJ